MISIKKILTLALLIQTVSILYGRKKPFSINAEELLRISRDASKKRHSYETASKSRLLKKIDEAQKKLSLLAQQKDKGHIGTAQYETEKNGYEREIEDATKRIERLESRYDKVDDLANKIIGTGFQTFLDHEKAEDERKTQAAVAGVKASVENEGAMERLKHMTAVFSDPSNLQKAGIFLTATSVGVTGGYYLTKLLYNQCTIYLNKKPALVEESSYQGWAATKWNAMFSKSNHESIFDDIILHKKVKKQLMELAHTTKQSKKMGLPYRSILLHGKPGTGKTMFAKKLAHFANMDYAIVFGGRISAKNIDELKEVFAWAKTSVRGVILFIDEAEAFLSNRDGMSHENRQVLNTFLALTGEFSEDICVVLTSNRPQDLDQAVYNRIDESIHMPLPDLACREALLNLYFKKFILDDTRTIQRNGQSIKAKIALSPTIEMEKMLAEAAHKLDGHSGRTIAKMVNSLRLQAYLQDDITLTQEMFEETLERKMQAAANEAAAAA